MALYLVPRRKRFCSVVQCGAGRAATRVASAAISSAVSRSLRAQPHISAAHRARTAVLSHCELQFRKVAICDRSSATGMLNSIFNWLLDHFPQIIFSIISERYVMEIEEVERKVRRLMRPADADRIFQCRHDQISFDHHLTEIDSSKVVYAVWRGGFCIYVGIHTGSDCGAENYERFDYDMWVLLRRFSGFKLSGINECDDDRPSDTDAFFAFRNMMRIDKGGLSLREVNSYLSKFQIIYWFINNDPDAYKLKSALVRCFSPCCNEEVYKKYRFVRHPLLRHFETRGEAQLLELVGHDGMLLAHIETPSDALQLAAVRQDGNAI